MMILRVVGLLLAIGLIVLLIMYIFTKNKNYLILVKNITRYTISAILIILVIYIFMRLAHL
jgi:succinate dehydrogenase hydrophobic anchor subunit